MKILTPDLTGLFFLIVFSCSNPSSQLIDPDTELDLAANQLAKSLEWLGDTNRNPRCMEDGSVQLVRSSDWTSGFFPGMLWIMHEHEGSQAWNEAAQHFSRNIEREKFNGRTHDMGFKIYCSFGRGYLLSGDPEIREILIQSARTLSTRYHQKVGLIRSWDHNRDKWDYPVIIDNMMNLELLFWATRETGDSSFYEIALSHAEKTLKNHYRPDYSSYHVVDYDTLSGEVVARNTHQGFEHESAWARGQAWGLYGFTIVYRETGKEIFLEHARNIAAYMLNHPNLPEDMVPYWDYDVPGQPDIPRDVSAASITASALYELSIFGNDKQTSSDYLDAANHIMSSLASEYKLEGEHPYPFLLDHSTGNYNKNSEVDVPIIYADYYFMEALLRLKELGQDR